MFKKRENIYDIEEGNLLSPKFDNDGLIPVITMCSKTKDILMHGYMNSEAFRYQKSFEQNPKPPHFQNIQFLMIPMSKNVKNEKMPTNIFDRCYNM